MKRSAGLAAVVALVIYQIATTRGTTTLRNPAVATTPCMIEVDCVSHCVRIIGSDGCLTCVCPPTCQDVNCTADEKCVLQQVICKRAPCFPVPTCVPKTEFCFGTPNTNRCGGSKLCWFYNSSANACQRFRFYGCTPSPNTFLSLEACEDNCTRWDSPICPAIACAHGCHAYKRRNHCPECICPNPCKNLYCKANEVCKLREVNCDEAEKPCNTAAYCAPK